MALDQLHKTYIAISEHNDELEADLSQARHDLVDARACNFNLRRALHKATHPWVLVDDDLPSNNSPVCVHIKVEADRGHRYMVSMGRYMHDGDEPGWQVGDKTAVVLCWAYFPDNLPYFDQ